MDISKLTHGAKLVLGASIAFLIVSIFNWQEVDIGIASAGVSMWHGWASSPACSRSRSSSGRGSASPR